MDREKLRWRGKPPTVEDYDKVWRAFYQVVFAIAVAVAVLLVIQYLDRANNNIGSQGSGLGNHGRVISRAAA